MPGRDANNDTKTYTDYIGSPSTYLIMFNIVIFVTINKYIKNIYYIAVMKHDTVNLRQNANLVMVFISKYYPKLYTFQPQAQ